MCNELKPTYNRYNMFDVYFGTYWFFKYLNVLYLIGVRADSFRIYEGIINNIIVFYIYFTDQHYT